jgi:2-amino-4-hydroxy-6-hydroxymethyldihydropteridine diphosphokinase
MNDFSVKAFLSLGSNEGNSHAHLENALQEIRQLEKTEVISVSNLYKTAAWGKTDQADFLNIAVEVNTFMNAENLLKNLIRIEEKSGRRRTEKWGPRTIDIDILLYGNEISNSKNLVLPHPEMHKRKFVLVPMIDLAPEMIHPVLKKSIKQLLVDCDDKGEVVAKGKFIGE